MDARQATLSPWVAEVRARVAASPEFRALSQKLFVEVREGMRRNGPSAVAVLPFGELSAEDQLARVREARDELLASEEFARCRDATWRAADAALDAESETALVAHPEATSSLGRSPAAPSAGLRAALTPTASATGGKVCRVVELAGVGAAQLLDRWPTQTELPWEQRSLAWLINASLPPPLRRALWRVKLRARDARTRFEAKMAESPLATISPRDAEILQQCQVALQGSDRENLSQLPRMRACASYVDSIDSIARALEQRARAAEEEQEVAATGAAGQRRPAPPREVFWLVPLLRALPGCEPSELVERYVALLAMPKPHLQAGAALPLALELLEQKDKPLATHVGKVLGGAGRLLLRAYSSRMGVGLFSADAALFVWDIGLLAGWEIVECAIAAALVLLRGGLLACAKPDDLVAYVELSVPLLNVEQLRASLERDYMPAIRQRLKAPPPDDIITLEPSDLVS